MHVNIKQLWMFERFYRRTVCSNSDTKEVENLQ
jgi:hypothetical protein